MPETDVSETSVELDRRHMRAAIALARRGWGRTAPNPAVGAIIVCPRTGAILARGWTQPGGRPHAETEAIARAGPAARGAVLYVTLEPCSHHGQTLPCCDAIIASAIGRVVCGIEDPDPRVAGRGLARLRSHGIAVTRGVESAACRHLALGHILRVTERRPFVQLKLAVAPDGSAPRGVDGQPRWVTGQQARAFGHLLRARADAILVGHRTVADDDPALTCRLPGLAHRSPHRVVLLGRTAKIPAHGKLVTGTQLPPTWWFAGSDAILADDGRHVVRVPTVSGRLWLPAVMEELVARGTTRLLVEGGPRIWRAFDDAGLVDEVVMFANRRSDVGTPPDVAWELLRGHLARAELRLVRHFPLASDDMFVFQRCRTSKEM